MGRSSIPVLFLAIWTASAPSSSAAPAPRGAIRASGGGERLAPPPPGRGGLRGRSLAGGFGGYGAGGYGFGPLGIGPDLTLPPPPVPSEPRGQVPVVFAAPPLPPRCPLVIQVGHGLRRPVPTRVVYGLPGCV